MVHLDWAAWDRWMEMNDHLVQQGIVPTCEEVTAMVDNHREITDRDINVANFQKIQRDEHNLEESKMSYYGV